MRITEQLIAVTDAYCRAVGLSVSRVSTLIFNDGKRLGSIRAGHDLYTRRFEYAMSWFSDHWPEDSETWPLGVPRPLANKASSHEEDSAK